MRKKSTVLDVLILIIVLVILNQNVSKASINIPSATFEGWEKGFCDEDLKYISTHNELLITDGYSYFNGKLNYIRSQNDKIKIIPYRNGSAIYKNTPDYDFVVENHPEWILKGVNNQSVFEASYPINFLMDIGNPDVVSFKVKRIEELVNQFNYDGIYLDMLGPYLWVGQGGYSSQPINPRTQNPYSNKEWADAVAVYLKSVKQRLGKNKIVIFNGVGNGYNFDKYCTRELINAADGFVVEGFMRWSNSSAEQYPTEQDWLKNISILDTLNNKNKIGIIMTSVSGVNTNPAQEKQIHDFAFCSYLLCRSDNIYFDFVKPSNNRYQDEDEFFRIKLGSPLSNYYKSNNVYQRDFASGKVLVNPSSSKQYSIKLPTAYTDLDGRPITQAIMPPHTGLLLVKPSDNDAK